VEGSKSLLLSKGTSRLRRFGKTVLELFLLMITSSSALAVLFIFFYIIKEAYPFFKIEGFREFFASTAWYPAAQEPHFGALAIFFGSAMVNLGSIVLSVPLGVFAAVCVSEILPFTMRQFVKPVIEMLAAIPSVAYGFFALVIFAPRLQEHGGLYLEIATWALGLPTGALLVFLLSDILSARISGEHYLKARIGIAAILGVILILVLRSVGSRLGAIQVASGANAMNVSIILAVMVLPTVVSVSEDALQSVGRELREGSYALGSTRAETIGRVVLPAASSGICAAVILGTMRAIGETMVVWMASGNAASIPEPWYNFLAPIRTLTATIAGEMGEADQISGASRYHVLYAMAFCLLVFSFLGNLASEWAVRRNRRKLRGE
jgi:phosphate transport system permease protein